MNNILRVLIIEDSESDANLILASCGAQDTLRSANGCKRPLKWMKPSRGKTGIS